MVEGKIEEKTKNKMAKKIKLRSGLEVEFDEQAPKTLFEIIISEVLIPKYKTFQSYILCK